MANGESWFTAKNRLNLAGGFDAAGNQTASDPFTLAYDAENRQISASSATLGTSNCAYDGEGRRVAKTTPTSTTYYVYDAMGQLGAEYATGATAASPCTTCYVAADHLGSTCALWDTSGLKARYDYSPFGEAIAADRNGRTGLQCAAGVTTCYNSIPPTSRN